MAAAVQVSKEHSFMANGRYSSVRLGAANRIVRTLIALLFLVVVPLNAYAIGSS